MPCQANSFGPGRTLLAHIVVDVVRYPHMFASSEIGPDGGSSSLWRWVIDPDTGTVSETQIDDRASEFPRVPDARVGRPHRFGYTAAQDRARPDDFDFDGLVKYDAATDRSDVIIVDARDFTAPPVATIHLPVRVPYGFHGSWVPTR